MYKKENMEIFPILGWKYENLWFFLKDFTCRERNFHSKKSIWSSLYIGNIQGEFFKKHLAKNVPWPKSATSPAWHFFKKKKKQKQARAMTSTLTQIFQKNLLWEKNVGYNFHPHLFFSHFQYLRWHIKKAWCKKQVSRWELPTWKPVFWDDKLKRVLIQHGDLFSLTPKKVNNTWTASCEPVSGNGGSKLVIHR